VIITPSWASKFACIPHLLACMITSAQDYICPSHLSCSLLVRLLQQSQKACQQLNIHVDLLSHGNCRLSESQTQQGQPAWQLTTSHAGELALIITSKAVQSVAMPTRPQTMQGQRHMDGMGVMPEAPAACVPVAEKLGGGPEHCTASLLTRCS
jgi:hypothetical protein